MQRFAEPVPREAENPAAYAARLALLMQCFPEAVADGKINFDRLRSELGEAVAEPGRFLFTWAGRGNAVDVRTTSPIRSPAICKSPRTSPFRRTEG